MPCNSVTFYVKKWNYRITVICLFLLAVNKLSSVQFSSELVRTPKSQCSCCSVCVMWCLWLRSFLVQAAVHRKEDRDCSYISLKCIKICPNSMENSRSPEPTNFFMATPLPRLEPYSLL